MPWWRPCCHGCASVSLEQNLHRVNDEVADFTAGQLTLASNPQDHAQRLENSAKLLATPVGPKEAIHIALLNSPALQALLAQGWAESADAAQSGRIPNPVLGLERLIAGNELELGRTLSLGLLDVLTLPTRQGVAQRRIEQAQLRLSSEVVDHITRVRQAWVRAVAAQQTLKYAQQVFASAEASAELARRMQAVGNFNRISRAREQAFYADAATRLALAQHQATANREELARSLGLDPSQSQKLQLPERLPDLPAQTLTPEAVRAMASKTRLDIRLAQIALDAASQAQGLNKITSLTDIEWTAQRNSQFDNASNSRTSSRGYEIAVRLPLLDSGDMQRAAWNARTLAAAHQLQATVGAASSHLRESYSAYRTTYDIARHYRDEIVPLRQVIAEENQLRYNGMMIGVFELLADAREQISSVIAAIQAQQQFWLADAALQASLMGRPTNTTVSVTSSAPSSGAAGH